MPRCSLNTWASLLLSIYKNAYNTVDITFVVFPYVAPGDLIA